MCITKRNVLGAAAGGIAHRSQASPRVVAMSETAQSANPSARSSAIRSACLRQVPRRSPGA